MPQTKNELHTRTVADLVHTINAGFIEPASAIITIVLCSYYEQALLLQYPVGNLAKMIRRTIHEN